MGNLIVEQDGPGNFVSVGVGTHVLPNNGVDCIIVGGNLVAKKEIQVFNQINGFTCDIVYKGTAEGKDNWKTNGSVINDPNYDMTHYQTMMGIWEKKSLYWASLTETATISEEYGQTIFSCTQNDDIQVFSVSKEQRYMFKKDPGAAHQISSYKFTSNCEGKTILINFQGDGDIKITAAAMIDFNDQQAVGEGGFNNCFKSSILWNFPEADNVDIGVSVQNSEFQGSILATGNLKMVTAGHSGRVVVLGDINHDSTVGSEFHTYQFKPPFNLPDPDDICECPTPTAPVAPTLPPTDAPTDALTNPPTPADCYSPPDPNNPPQCFKRNWDPYDNRYCYPKQTCASWEMDGNSGAKTWEECCSNHCRGTGLTKNKPCPTPTTPTAPTNAPTNAPVAPTDAPTDRPTAPPGTYECVFPPGTDGFAIISKNGSQIDAHDTYRGVAVGGTIWKTWGGPNSVISSKGSYPSYMVALSPNASINFNGPKYTNYQLSDIPLDFGHFEWLAQNIKHNSNNQKVRVVTNGGSFNMCEFFGGQAQDYDKGQRMIVFNTSDDIRLVPCSDGRKFGPSVLAPFSKVTLDTQFIDGFVVARTFYSINSNQQCHGEVYEGPLVCE